ncbi:MAG: NAD(+)/NADH kinase, partial [Novosphingobium sp.]
MPEFARLALLASPSERAQEACEALRRTRDWVSLEDADAAVVIGGDGFMLQTLHTMLDIDHVVPAFGLNLGTVGFLMNKYRSSRGIEERLAKATEITVSPLRMT